VMAKVECYLLLDQYGERECEVDADCKPDPTCGRVAHLVEVVTCAECRHRKPKWCDLHPGLCFDDVSRPGFYCSDGERAEVGK
jgi:hypothetical protein